MNTKFAVSAYTTMRTKRYHHIIDLEECNGKIADREAVAAFVTMVAEAVNMHILQGPVVAEGIEQNPGFSAIAIIDYSHISVHTFTAYNEVLIDVFSCKEYDRERVYAVCLEYFGTPATTAKQQEVAWG